MIPALQTNILINQLTTCASRKMVSTTVELNKCLPKSLSQLLRIAP